MFIFEEIYKRHVKNLRRHPERGDNIRVGVSPFISGPIEIDIEKGSFYCINSGKNGSCIQFQMELYPLLTFAGAMAAVKEEGLIFHFNESLNTLNKAAFYKSEKITKADINEEWLEVYGLKQSEVEVLPFWYFTSDFKFMYFSHTSEPLWCYSWSTTPEYLDPEDLDSTYVFGAPRLQVSHEKRIHFVYDPIRAELMRMSGKTSVYVRPTTQMFQYNDYQKLIDGKEVICYLPDTSSPSFRTKQKEVKLTCNDATKLLEIYDEPAHKGV